MAIMGALLLTFTSQAAPADSAYWQLDVSFAAGEARLTSAYQLPAMKKKVRTPAGGGAVRSESYTLTWEDGSGSVLHETEVTIPLGVRIPPDAGDDLGGLVTETGSFTIRVTGPGPTAQPARISLRHNAPQFLSLSDSEQQVLPDTMTFELPDSGQRKAQPPVGVLTGPVDGTKIHSTGPDGNRLVLVIMGDGYLQADIDDGTFAANSAAFLSYLETQSPWDIILQGANVYRVDIVSKERGADYEDASPATGTLKDTHLDSRFWFDGVTERLLSIRDSTAAVNAANSFVGAGVWDEIVVLVNSTKYGGAGGSFAVASMNSSSKEIAAHELGHSFGNCADEYFYTSNTYTGGNPSRPNTDTSPTAPKWGAWIEPGTPLPTTDSAAYDSTVGTFEGAYYNEYGIYRPWRNCKMRALNRAFCPVCKEAHILEYLDLVSLIDDARPGESPVYLNAATNFDASPLPLPGIVLNWSRDSKSIGGATGTVLTVETTDFTAPTGNVSVTVSYSSPLVRQQTDSASHSWPVTNTAVTQRGTPHWWLSRHELSPPDGDLFDEGDGMAAWEEYRAGTDPTSSVSLLEITGVSYLTNTGEVVLNWSSASNRSYRVARHDSGITGTGVTVATGIASTPPQNSLSLPVGLCTQSFFRITVDAR